MTVLTAAPTLERPATMDHAFIVGSSVEPDELENRRWVRGIQASDHAVLESFFRSVQPRLLRYAERFVSGDAAHDIVQEAFVKIWSGREQLDPNRSLKALAYRTVRNLALNRVRDRNRRGELLQLNVVENRRPARADAATMEEELSEKVEGWIEALPDRQREALRLSRVAGLTHQEVAEAMDLSARTVNNHLVRALRTLRDHVRAYDPTLLSP